MNGICDCDMTMDEPARPADCDDCGSPCCRSCQVDLGAHTYCRRCAAAFIAA